ncbi:hypothetical protein [Bartonella taylorii]|uniref:hypothetical protein n=1 Tax=Bartonella taylorii TaxID=33046 RepID=UPI0023EE83F3|nr:hypothetical protein [Bartonella taylorii]
MPIPYHTHKFTLEPATKEEVKEGVLDDKALAPVSVGSAAAYEVEYFATAAQGKKADDAVAKRDIGALAYKDKVTICDIEASGEARENTILSGAGWVKISPLGIGDMKAATYDPDNVRSNAFSMENMHEGSTKKILTTEERLKLEWLSPNGPTMEKWCMGNEGVRYPISPLELKNTINYFALSKSLGMSKSVYDPNKIAKDAFDMENMREGNTHLIFTSQERTQVAKIDKIGNVAQHAQESAQQGLNAASEAKDVADSALNTAKDAQIQAVDAKTIAEAAQKTGEMAQAAASVAQETADKAQDTAQSVQKKVDRIQPLAKQDWIDGTKTVDALISPADLFSSIKANSENSNNSGGGGYKPVEILMTENGDIPWPEGTTDDTELEIWAWGGGNAGDRIYNGIGGAGGCCTYLKTKKKFLGNSSVRIGKGGVASGREYGNSTEVGHFITALGGGGKYPNGGIDAPHGSMGTKVGDQGSNGGYGCIGGKGGDGGRGGAGGAGGHGGDGGDNFLSNGGAGGVGGYGGEGGDSDGGYGGMGGNGGKSIYGCGGCGGRGGDGGGGGHNASGNWSGRGGWGGGGGSGGSSIYGGGGGGGSGGRGNNGKNGYEANGRGGRGGNSIYGGGGGGGRSGHDGGFSGGEGGHSMWGGKGGKGHGGGHGGGGGYFSGKDATSSSSGDGGDGAVLIKIYL